MNLKLNFLKLALLNFVLFFFFGFASAIVPNTIPEFDDHLSELLVGRSGSILNDFFLDPDFPIFPDAHYKARLLEISGAIQYRWTADIKNHIIHRTERYRSATERTLGLSEMYFPVFEEYLAKYNIPHHLKYLPIVESNLNAVARSHASAVGLWQFIPGTGRLYGLKVASYLDERSDTHKASNAAAKMLSQLFQRYNDWPLALAAYNCGPGRVDKYVKGTNKDFWDIRHLLPRETQMYVPYFMAVVYSYEFHHLHELKPRRLSTDLILTDTIHLQPGYKSLSHLSSKYKIGKDTLKLLNPGYVKNYVPSSSVSSILVLPVRIISKLRNYEHHYNVMMSTEAENPIKCIRRVNSEKELQFLMKAHRFTRHDLLYWNDLPKNYKVSEGDVIAVRKYYAPKHTRKEKKERKLVKGIVMPSLKVVGFSSASQKAQTTPVYVNVNIHKLCDRVSPLVVASVAKEYSIGMVAGSDSHESNNSTNKNIVVQKAQKTEIVDQVSKNRSRGRRLRTQRISSSRNSAAPSGSYEYPKPQILAVKPTSNVNKRKSNREPETKKN
ncbi:MAG: lytic transglycosylase domain-containing protein [Saprospiraceae bacterium]|nr:lytic transglycosylase domain-containing protein [Saprospiraceae bacterium]